MKIRQVWVCLCLAAPAYAQYAGPAILARGEAPSQLVVPDIRFLPHASVAGTYDTGLAAASVNDKGQLANAASYGYTVSWGISGSHHWRHTQLGLSYDGSVTKYTNYTAYGSLYQALMINLRHQFSKHMQFTLQEGAGASSRNYNIGGLSETVPFDPSTTYVPRTDFFDNRTVYTTTQAGFVYQKTARLSFDMSGQAFTNNRESHSLASSWGTGAQGDVQYRVSRNTTVGVIYQYSHFGFSNVGGGTDAHALAGSYSRRISRNWETSGFAGAMRVESTFLQTQAVDPLIAALLGITNVVQIRHTLIYSPYLEGRVTRSMRRGVAYVSAGRSVTPGNGLFLTSFATTVMGGYSYTAFRRWSINAQVGYITATSEGNITGKYANQTESISIGRQLKRYVGLSASYTSRKYSSPDFADYNRRIDTAIVSLSFSPGEVRLPIH